MSDENMPREKPYRHPPNKKLKQARLQKGWSYQELADQIGLGNSKTVGRWERGAAFPQNFFHQKLCDAFQMSAEDLGLVKASRTYPLPEPEDLEIAHSSKEEEHTPIDTEPISQATDPFPQTQLRSLPPDPSPESSSTSLADPNRKSLLKQVHTTWIKGMLERSLHSMVRLALGLQDRPDLLANPWSLIVQETNQAPRAFDPTMTVTRAYDDAEGKMLILGEPGAGKTTLLLELTRDLLQRAHADGTHPLPVVFHLSSWTQQRQAIDVWIIQELRHNYRVPEKIAQEWVQNESLLLLLDGLDEVAQRHRIACIEMINAYRREHSRVPMVICSRINEYLASPIRLHLQTAVLIQKLSKEQVNKSIASGGKSLEGLQRALHQDGEFFEMARIPLMLNIFMFAYQGMTVEDIANNASQEQVFRIYVQRMLKRRGKSYSDRQVIYWLSYLARQMKLRSQTLFYLEFLQPDWLLGGQAHLWYTLCGNGVLGMAFGLAIGGLIGGIIGGTTTLLDQLPFLPPEGPDNGLFFGSLFGAVLGMIAGLVVGLQRNRQGNPITLKEKRVWSWKVMRKHLLRCVCIGLISKLIFEHIVLWALTWKLFQAGLIVLCVYEFVGMLVGACAYVLSAITTQKARSTQFMKQIANEAELGILAGLLSGLFSDLFAGQLGGPVARLVLILFNGYFLTSSGQIVTGLLGGIMGGLYFGGINGFTNTLMPEHERISPNYGIKQSLRNSLFFGSICMLLFLMIFWTVGAIKHTIIVGFFFSLLVGLILALINGGTSFIFHGLLRFFLKYRGFIPDDYIYFLDYSAEHLLLQKVGGGYAFIHQLLRDYFASIEPPPPVDTTIPFQENF